MSRSKGWWRLFKRRSSFFHAGWGLCLFDGRVHSPGWRGLVCMVERFRSLWLLGLSGGGRVPFALGSGGLFEWWKGSVRSYSFHPWSRIDGERVRGAPRRAPDTPGSRPTKSAALPLPSPPFPRFRSVVIRHPAFPDLRPGLLGPSLGLAPSGPPQAAFKSAPGAFVHAGMTWLVNSGSAILMPVPTPLTLNFLCFTRRFLSL